MKRLVGLIALLILMGCSSSNSEADKVSKLELRTENIEASAAEYRGSIEFECNNSWNIEIHPTSAVEWVSISSIEGKAGEHRLELLLKPNEKNSNRKAELYFKSGKLLKSLIITQNEEQDIYIPYKEKFMEKEGGEVAVTVYHNVDTFFEISDDWIKESVNGTRALQTTEWNFTVSSNPEFESRVGSITFFNESESIKEKVTIEQKGKEKPFEINVDLLNLLVGSSTTDIYVISDSHDYTITQSPETDWCSVEKEASKGRVKMKVSTNLNEERATTITFSKGGYKHDIAVTQEAFDNNIYYTNKEVVQLQSATKGRGINIVLMGDGYIVSQLKKSEGKYEQDMRAAMEHFFSVYPYDHYRDHFNVYMVAAISEEEGMSMKSPILNVDTKFETTREKHETTRIDCNLETVQEFTQPVVRLAGVPIDDITVIVPINKYTYAGTCWMWDSGYSISLCPVGSQFKDIVVHEAAGHGFAKLADEYFYGASRITQEEIEKAKRRQQIGTYLNIDFSSFINEVYWSEFTKYPQYSMVSIFEGAYTYAHGVWRSEENSCMVGNIPYFNAVSRWLQMRKIHQMAGFPYSFEQFLKDDIIPTVPEQIVTKGVGEIFIPLAPPVFVDEELER